MARRVVKAETKRRAREEYKLNATKQQPQAKKPAMSSLSSNAQNITSQKPDEPVAPKMKRLFQWAIVKLYEEGSVVLWDGAVRPLPSHNEGREISGLWKVNSMAGADSTMFSSMSGTTSRTTSRIENEVEDDGNISDPPTNGEEEAYISLTPAHLAPHVEKAISTLMARSRSTAVHAHNHTNKISDRTHKLPKPAPPPGPTKEEITTFLRRVDGRWARVGEWVVDDALEVLRKEDKVWRIGKGQWELCL